jgi:alpha-mannosidase
VNTSWDVARFEICAHRWLHVGEPGYGVALLNETTYGHDVSRSARAGGGSTTTVRWSLLRAPRFPDPLTDQGRHSFRHALVAGASVADAVREGYQFHLPLRTAPGSHPVAPLVTVDHPGVVVEAVKLADDRSGDLVVRLYEALGDRTRARLAVRVPITGLEEVDLLERPLPPGRSGPDGVPSVVAEGDGAELRLRPFQVVTLRMPLP